MNFSLVMYSRLFTEGSLDRGDALLQELLQRLQSGWLTSISRGTGARIDVEPVPGDGFRLIARWKGGQEYARHFSKRYVLGRSYSLPSSSFRLERKVCDYAKAFMREVLEQRGVL